MGAEVLILCHNMEVTMIDFRKISVSNKVKVAFADGDSLEGIISSIDDEEESGLGECGISIHTSDGRYIGIGESEVESIEVLE